MSTEHFLVKSELTGIHYDLEVNTQRYHCLVCRDSGVERFATEEDKRAFNKAFEVWEPMDEDDEGPEFHETGERPCSICSGNPASVGEKDQVVTSWKMTHHSSIPIRPTHP